MESEGSLSMIITTRDLDAEIVARIQVREREFSAGVAEKGMVLRAGVEPACP